MVTVHNFSYGLVNPVLGYVMSCLGAFLGLRSVTGPSANRGSPGPLAPARGHFGRHVRHLDATTPVSL